MNGNLAMRQTIVNNFTVLYPPDKKRHISNIIVRFKADNLIYPIRKYQSLSFHFIFKKKSDMNERYTDSNASKHQSMTNCTRQDPNIN